MSISGTEEPSSRASPSGPGARPIAWFALALVVFAIFAVSSREAPVAPLCERCNVVLVSLDTLRADHLGCYGYERPTTPRIDAFASESFLFSDAISQSAWTRPAHASMLTGLHPREHGIVTMLKSAVLAENASTLPARLSASGYRTAAFTGGANMAAEFGFDNGFELYRSPGRRIEDHIPHIRTWLDGIGDEPFFLMVHGFDPHRPYKSEPVDRRALGLGAEPARGVNRVCTETKSKAEMGPFVAEYDAAIHRGDRGFGRLLDVLRDRGVYDRTVVVLTSDHGEEFLEHGRCFHIRTLYREVVRVPLIVRVPGAEPARIAGVVPASVAVAPTVLELVGDRDRSFPGPSLLPAMASGAAAFPFVVSETGSRVGPQGYGRVRAITSDTEKLVHWIDQDRVEYYDLAADPFETKPAAGGRRADAMMARLLRWESMHSRRLHATSARAVPHDVLKALQALGYVTEEDGESP